MFLVHYNIIILYQLIKYGINYLNEQLLHLIVVSKSYLK